MLQRCPSDSSMTGIASSVTGGISQQFFEHSLTPSPPSGRTPLRGVADTLHTVPLEDYSSADAVSTTVTPSTTTSTRTSISASPTTLTTTPAPIPK